MFFGFSFGMFLGFWTAFESAVRLGCLCIPGGGMSSAARLAAMLDNGATVLCCTPTYALRLAEVAAAERIDLAASKVRRIIVAGEPGGSITAVRDPHRNAVERRQGGGPSRDDRDRPGSYGCPRGRMCCMRSNPAFIAEVIDPESGCPLRRAATASWC